MGKKAGFIGVRTVVDLKSGAISYLAEIREPVGQKRVRSRLGCFTTAEAAARQYDCVALAWRGPKARLNFSAANCSADDTASALEAVPDRHIKTSVYKGVVARGASFAAVTRWHHEQIWLGSYRSELFAAEQYDLAQIQLYGGTVTAVPPYKLNFDWSQHSPEVIRQLLPRVAAKVSAGLLRQLDDLSQPSSAQPNKDQPIAQQAVAEPTNSLRTGHSPQLLKRRQASSESDSDDRAAAGSLPAKRRRIGRQSLPFGQQAPCKSSSLSDMPGQQSTQQLTEPHQELQVTAGALPALECPQAATAAATTCLSIARPLVPAAAPVSKHPVGAVLLPFKVRKVKHQQLNQVQNLGNKTAAVKSVTQPGPMKQRQLQQLLTDDLHAAAVLVYCADDAYSTAEAAGLPRRQLKACRRDVRAAVQQLATAIEQTLLSVALPCSSSCEQVGYCPEQPMQHAPQRPDARLNSNSQRQPHSLTCAQSNISQQ